jgi:NADPH2:quinone reductase
MRAVVFERHGGPEVLEYKEVADPQPGEGEVLVEVEAAGVNYMDVYQRRGPGVQAPQLPAIAGTEGAGTIADTRERVAWASIAGSYAEKVVVSQDKIVPVPQGISLEVAAAALLQGMTAHYLASDSYPIAEGDWIIVHSAAGGVGLLLTQIAQLRGGRVIGTTSTEEKATVAKQAGADEVLGYENFVERSRAITNGEGVAAVYDGVGRATFLAGLNALRPTGRMILYGAASGQPDPFDTSVLAARGSLYLHRPTVRTYTRTPDLLRNRAQQLFELIESGKLNVRIGSRYPLEQAHLAHEKLEARRTTGKLLLVP